MLKQFPDVKEFQEFPLSEAEIAQILFTMVSTSLFVLDAQRYEKAHVRYEERMER